jgi:hypothetical protein
VILGLDEAREVVLESLCLLTLPLFLLADELQLALALALSLHQSQFINLAEYE